MSHCDHKFVDSKACLRCGISFAALKAESLRESQRLNAEPAPSPQPEMPERMCRARIHGEEMLRDFAYCNLWKPFRTRDDAMALVPARWDRWPCSSPRRNQCRSGGVPQKPDPWNPSHGWFVYPFPESP